MENAMNLNFDFMFQVYFQVVWIEKQIVSFVFWEKLRLNNFVSRSTNQLSPIHYAP